MSGTLVANLLGIWHDRVSTEICWPSVITLRLGEMASLICSFYFSVTTHSWANPSLCDVKQKTTPPKKASVQCALWTRRLRTPPELSFTDIVLVYSLSFLSFVFYLHFYFPQFRDECEITWEWKRAQIQKLPLATILKTVGWRRPSTFATFYKKPICEGNAFQNAVLSQNWGMHLLMICFIGCVEAGIAQLVVLGLAVHSVAGSILLWGHFR